MTDNSQHTTTLLPPPTATTMTTPPRGGGQNTAKRQKQWCEKLSIEEKSLLGICSFVVHQLGKDALKTSCLCCNCETRSKCVAVLCTYYISVSHSHTVLSPLLPAWRKHWDASLGSYDAAPKLPSPTMEAQVIQVHSWLPSNPSNQGATHCASGFTSPGFSWKTSKELKKMNALLYRYICI